LQRPVSNVFYLISENIIAKILASFVLTIILFNGFIHGPFLGLIIGFFGYIMGILRISELNPRTIDNFFWGVVYHAPGAIDFGLFGFLIGIIALKIRNNILKSKIIVFSVSTIILHIFDYNILTIIAKEKKQINMVLYESIIDRALPIVLNVIIGSILLFFYYKYIKNRCKCGHFA
jgi:hypothetical protein